MTRPTTESETHEVSTNPLSAIPPRPGALVLHKCRSCGQGDRRFDRADDGTCAHCGGPYDGKTDPPAESQRAHIVRAMTTGQVSRYEACVFCDRQTIQRGRDRDRCHHCSMGYELIEGRWYPRLTDELRERYRALGIDPPTPDEAES